MAARDPGRERTRAEFTRQAEGLARAAVFRSHAILERIARAVAARPESRILDAACGPGLVSAHLARDGSDLVGIDLTAEMARRARMRARDENATRARFAIAAAEELPFYDGSFDRIVARLSLHHFASPGAVLREFERVLAPSGRLVIADVVSSEDGREAAEHNALEQLRDPSHMRMLPRSELVARIRSVGLGVEIAEAWSEPRELDEWVAITGSDERREELRARMLGLARRGRRLGIGLREEGSRLCFEHHWVIAVGERPPEPR